MRTRSQARRLRQHQRQQQQVPPNLVEPPKDTMADNRTMAELLQAPTEGYEDAIVVPEIAAANFEIKHGLLTLVQNKQFFGHDKEDPHAHIRYFNKITSTLRYPNVPTTSIKLMLFPFSLEGAARIWLEKEPPRSIQTWDDLFRQSRSKAIVSKVSTSSSTPAVSSDVAELKDMVRALILDKKNQTPAPAPIKAVEQSCVTCGGGHSYQNCPATDGNIYRDIPIINVHSIQAAAVNYNQGNASYRPQMVANQIRPPAPVPPAPGVSKPDFDNYVQANDAEVDIIKKTENQAKMTKLSMEWKRLCKIKAKVQKCQSQSQNRRISSQTGAGTEEYY
ncbi:hypothetical protein Tco_0463135 [Tanacetum coccineum]